MSSVASLRSYQKRRKSAGARLEGAASCQGSLSGLQQPHPPDAADGHAPPRQQLRAKFREKRVKSAIETRREQEASDVFPEPKGSVDPEWGKTKYSEDFGPKKILSPVHVRPASPTRMNNPHPSMEFLQWKFPVRIHEHKKAVPPPPDIWRYINERFYEDYLDVYNTGDAKNEVPITNLAKIAFPGKKEKSKSSTINGISGKKAQLNSRRSAQGKGSDASKEGNLPTLIQPPSPQSLMMHQAIKGSTLPLFKEWLKTATDKERTLLLQMLQAAQGDSEEVQMSKVVNEVLQPDSAEKVQEWLKSTSSSERQMVLRVLETLAVATGEEEAYGLTYPPALYPRLQHRHHHHHQRYSTFPFSLQGQGGHHHTHTHHHHHNSSKRGHHHHHHHRHHSSSSGKHSSRSKQHSSATSSDTTPSESTSDMGLVGKKIVKPGKEFYDENPQIWHNRILRKKFGTSLVHPAGIFNQPQRDVGQHFAIHPEWPTA